MEHKTTGADVGDMVEMTIRCQDCPTPLRVVWRSILQHNGRYAMRMTRSVSIGGVTRTFGKCPKNGTVCPGTIYKKGEVAPHARRYKEKQ